MAATRGAPSINSFFKPIIRKYCTKCSGGVDTLQEPMRMEAKEVKRKTTTVGGYHDGSCCWVPHHQTGIYYPKGHEKVMADVSAHATKDHQINWFPYD
ncbi:hypothetical protein F3Y22_tig00110318pilonHSYRG00084 [Hibiscus syriacus]|uniref:Uncharacterized protein n=1 Tax=Hibiscus syriacus TaxID=106335 RepID=A0A6A3B1U4_HIBSY|nr:uncharacterized protein LOC120117042 [Hibiscus syriacus]KAE8710920.1 hypothetical protein F3Y22_tig00110318pilonHSYRG00084 [Hibiscus syriacus]